MILNFGGGGSDNALEVDNFESLEESSANVLFNYFELFRNYYTKANVDNIIGDLVTKTDMAARIKALDNKFAGKNALDSIEETVAAVLCDLNDRIAAIEA